MVRGAARWVRRFRAPRPEARGHVDFEGQLTGEGDAEDARHDTRDLCLNHGHERKGLIAQIGIA